jgi:hypothetical protein
LPELALDLSQIGKRVKANLFISECRWTSVGSKLPRSFRET